MIVFPSWIWHKSPIAIVLSVRFAITRFAHRRIFEQVLDEQETDQQHSEDNEYDEKLISEGQNRPPLPARSKLNQVENDKNYYFMNENCGRGCLIVSYNIKLTNTTLFSSFNLIFSCFSEPQVLSLFERCTRLSIANKLIF